MSPRRLAGAVAAIGLALGPAACGDDDGPLATAEDHLASLEAAELDLQLSATAGRGDEQTGPVGFRMAGPYSFAGDTDLAVFDLEYTRLLGGAQETTRVRSTGDRAFVTVDDVTYLVPEDDAAALRLGDGDGGFGDLGIAGWVVDPEVEERDGERRVVGRVDAADLLSDLARVAGPIAGDGDLDPLDDETGERLQDLVEDSSFEALVGEDGELRSLVAVVDFGPSVPDELREALGRYAQARIEVRLSVVEADEDLEVPEPEGYEEL